jgi:WD40 repeat protein
MRLLTGVSILLLSSLYAAEPGDLRTPSMGFAYDGRSNQIRPIHGFPGAAILGDSLPNTIAFSSLVVSPRHDLALGISAADQQLLLLPLPAGEPKAVGEAMAASDHISFSPSGSAAVTWGSRIRILTGLRNAAHVAGLANPLPDSPPSTVAVSDDGRRVILVSGTRDTDPLWQLSAGGSFVQLALPGSIAAVAFRRDSHDAVAVTRSGDVYLIRNPGADAAIRQVYVGDEQTSDAVAVQLSPDGSRAFTANARGTIAAIDLKTGTTAAVSCQCSPTALEPLDATSVFRLTEISDRPLMLFDASMTTPRIWFVPADAPAAQQRSAQ